jgi:hypothetical protein
MKPISLFVGDMSLGYLLCLAIVSRDWEIFSCFLLLVMLRISIFLKLNFLEEEA